MTTRPTPTRPTPRAEPANDRDDVLPPTLGEVVLRWVRDAAVVAVCLSLFAHAAGWQISRYILLGPGSRPGSASTDTGAVEMAVLTQGELDALLGDAIDPGLPSVPDALPDERADLPDVPVAIGDAGEAGGEPGLIGEVGEVGGGGNIGSGGDGLGLGGGGGGGASFFGIEATGQRFAYIVDVSASMDDVRMNALRRELIRSMDALLENAQFMIVKFSTESRIVGEVDGWQEASPAVRRAMRAHVEALRPEANTLPVPAFNIVFSKRPRPDAIYFMTDGEFSEEDSQRIMALARAMKVPVHGICLGSRDGEAAMRAISRATRGTYTFVRLDR